MLGMLGRYRGYVILTLFYALAFGGHVLYERRPQPEPIVLIEPTAAPSATPAPIQVHVAGAVQQPGLYTLSAASRLAQAIEAAGGLGPDADGESINLADYVRDGQQVYIPHLGTPAPPRPTPSGGGASSGATSFGLNSELININTASAEQLAMLPGIGPAYAERIIAYRQAHGPFTDPAQITEVKGIGEALYERIKGRISVR